MDNCQIGQNTGGGSNLDHANVRTGTRRADISQPTVNRQTRESVNANVKRQRLYTHIIMYMYACGAGYVS